MEGEILRKSHTFARCAKAAMLLLSLKQFPDRYLNTRSACFEKQEELMMRTREEDLRTALVVERMKRRKVKRFGLLALILQMVLLLSVWSFFFEIALSFY